MPPTAHCPLGPAAADRRFVRPFMWIEGWGRLPGRLVVVSGPSGSGKSTLIQRALERPELKVRLSVSATTRAPRPGEREAINYFFMTPEQFVAARDRDEFLEWAEFNHNL